VGTIFETQCIFQALQLKIQGLLQVFSRTYPVFKHFRGPWISKNRIQAISRIFQALINPENRNRAIFTKIFRGFWHKNYGSDPKKLGGAKMGWASSMCTQSLVEIGGHKMTGDENKGVFCLQICMFVCLSCWMSRKEVQMFNNV